MNGPLTVVAITLMFALILMLGIPVILYLLLCITEGIKNRKNKKEK